MAATDSLLRVELLVIEPWDFVSSHGSGPYNGAILAKRERSLKDPVELLIQLDQPISERGRRWTYFVASPRETGLDLSRIRPGLRMACALTSITNETSQPDAVFENVNYEEGINLLADVTVK